MGLCHKLKTFIPCFYWIHGLYSILVHLKTENEVTLTNKESESCLPATNTSWVSVGTMHDTAQFAVATLRRWWYLMGMAMYPDAKELLITADGGGGNGVRCRLWKVELQKFANETCLRTTVCHFPPDTSKWNKIEHGCSAISRAIGVDVH